MRMVTRSYCIIVLFLILPSICRENNTTNTFDIRDEHHNILKYTAVVLINITLLYGIISNSLMAAVLFCKRNNFYTQAFVLISLQLIISHFMAFLPQIIVVLPELLQTKNSSYVNQTTWINSTFATFNTFAIFAILHFSFLLTLNRFVAFILPKYNNFFESARLYFLIALVWLSAIAITFGDIYYCTRKFLAWNITWEGDCSKLSAGDIWWRIRYFWLLFIPNAMFAMYVAIFYSIRRKQRSAADINQNQKNKKIHGTRHETTVKTVKTYDYEWSMLIQAAWNCGVTEVGGIIFHFLPPFLVQIFGEAVNIPSNIFINCYVIFICTTLPTVYFIYNKAAHNIVKEYLYHLLHLKTTSLKSNTVTVNFRTHAK